MPDFKRQSLKDNFHKAFYRLTCPTFDDICFMKNNPPEAQLT